MDFWTRLIGGGGLTSSRGLRQNAAGERLTRCKQICNSLYQIWRSNPSFSPESPSVTHIRSHLSRLNSILGDELHGPAPHPCHTHVATSQVYLTVTKLALTSCDPDILSAAALLFNTLIDVEVNGLIDSRVFARAVVDLVRRAGFAGEEGKGRLVELIFGVANNIRLHPEILPVWFIRKDRDAETTEDPNPGPQEFAGETRRDDFPLFYLLVDYVHQEGRLGDFARTGVLYIIETASKSRDLERWLIESDLATLMATGLGAQYSQLSRSSFSSDTDDVPYIVALSDHAHLSTTTHPKSEEHMHAFRTYLLFWQDAIDYCKSIDVNNTLLDHFQVLFLEQLLYPSLLESSDVDGGSTSAVMMYLSWILESIDQPALVHQILHFLLASPSNKETDVQKETLDKKSPMYPSRRKSLDMLAMFTKEAPTPSPALFNLVDLVLISVKSKNIRTVTATLKLISVILERHQSFANLLFKSMQPSQPPIQARTIGAFNTELQHLMGMATSVIDDPLLDQSYESYLASASATVHPRSHLQLGNGGDETLDGPFTVQPSDAVLAGIMDVLAQFFTNSVMTNLVLTNALTALASSSLVSLDEWLLVHPNEYRYSPNTVPKEQEDTTNLPTDPPVDESGSRNTTPGPHEQPQWPPTNLPALPSIIQKLVHQVESWRQEISDFDILLAARRDLLASEGMESLGDEGTAQPTQRQGQGIASGDAGASETSTPPRGRNTSMLKIIGGSPKRTVRSKSATLKSGDSSVSRPTSRVRSSQLVRDLSARVVIGSRDSSSPGKAKSSLAPSDNTSANTSAPASDINETSVASEESETAQAKGGDGASQVETGAEGTKEVEGEGVTVGHILTNAVILYEFILELTALVQVRASVLDEVTFAR